MTESSEGKAISQQAPTKEGLPLSSQQTAGGVQRPSYPFRQDILSGKSALEIAEDQRGSEEFSYDSLPGSVRQALPEDTFNRLIAESLTHEVEEIERQREAQMGLFVQPESEKFKQEIENPNHRLDPETGINYAVTWLNKDKAGKPLVVKLHWSAGANSRTARGFLRALSSKADQPIVVVDSIATGGTSVPDRQWLKTADFDTMADSEKRVLDAELEANGLGDSQLDLLGISLGGIQVAKLAERYKNRVDNLLTFSTPGFKKKNPVRFALGFAIDDQKAGDKIVAEEDYGIKEESKYFTELFGKLGVQLKSEEMEGLYKVIPPILRVLKPVASDLTGLLPPEQFNAENVPAFFRFYYLMTRNPLANLPENLSPATRWHDVIGSKDPITDYADHLEAIRKRNQTLKRDGSGRMRGSANYNPHTSSVHILGGEPHAWIAINTDVAEKAVGLLKGSN